LEATRLTWRSEALSDHGSLMPETSSGVRTGIYDVADKRWISETLFEQLGLRTSYEVDRVLYEQQTEHQHLVLFENRRFGKVLMLDGATQVTTRDEFIYHEMMTHVPILAHGQARDVLIIGGGDCGIAEEALKHK